MAAVRIERQYRPKRTGGTTTIECCGSTASRAGDNARRGTAAIAEAANCKTLGKARTKKRN
jgi:hypothetical protein